MTTATSWSPTSPTRRERWSNLPSILTRASETKRVCDPLASYQSVAIFYLDYGQANHLHLTGRFLWGGNDFAGSAEDISFAIEGEDNVPVLRARLQNSEGELFDADVNLGEHVTNNNGTLEYQEESLL